MPVPGMLMDVVRLPLLSTRVRTPFAPNENETPDLLKVIRKGPIEMVLRKDQPTVVHLLSIRCRPHKWGQERIYSERTSAARNQVHEESSSSEQVATCRIHRCPHQSLTRKLKNSRGLLLRKPRLWSSSSNLITHRTTRRVLRPRGLLRLRVLRRHS